MRILGIDPGTRLTGYAIIDLLGNRLELVTQGTLRLQPPGKALPLEQRLLTLYEGVNSLIERFEPRTMSVEKVFHAKNAMSSLKLGHARGVLLLLAAQSKMDLFEYAATEVKQTLVGHGHASKEQIARMVQILVGQQVFDTEDASDATALAICHGHLLQSKVNSHGALKRRKNRTIAESLGYD